MIFLAWLCCTGTELSADLAVDDATAGTVNLKNCLASVGTTGDGGTAAVHDSYPIQALRDEYAPFRKMLYSAVIGGASLEASIPIPEVVCVV